MAIAQVDVEGQGGGMATASACATAAATAAAAVMELPLTLGGTQLGNGDNNGETAVSTEEQNGNNDSPAEGIVFPPPMSWYRSSVAASRDDMWAYCSAGVIVIVHPPTSYPVIAGGEPSGASNGGTQQDLGAIPDLKSKSSTDHSNRWPKFSLIGAQLEKYNAVSFCQSSWDYLPVDGAPLVSGCERGIVRVWNLAKKSTVIFHDNHAGNPITGLDWSPCDHSTIYAIDDKGSMSVWDVLKNSLRSMNFGKIVPTSLKASPHDKDIVCFGTKGGNVFVVDVTGNSGRILAKVRHEEEVISTPWMPKGGEWDVLKYFRAESKTKLPLLASTIHSMKLPTVRIWNQAGADVGVLQAWERDNKIRPFKIFGSAAWVRDPNSGKLMLISSGRHGEILSWSSSVVHDIIHKVHTHNAIFAIIQCGDIIWSLSYEPMIVGWNMRTMEVECVIPTFKGACTLAPSPVDSSRLAVGGTDSVIRILKCVAGYPTDGDVCTKAPIITHKLKGKVTAIAWHPTRDNYIGFGTDEGVLGVFELKDHNRYATQLDRRVSGTIYTVTFGPSVYTEDYVRPSRQDSGTEKHSDHNGGQNLGENAPEKMPVKGKENDALMLYACGGNAVYMISPSRATNPLISVSRIIEKTNQKAADKDAARFTDKATEIRWAPDFSLLAVGYHDGRIELYTPPYLGMKCWIKCHLRAVQFLTWRPFDFTSEGSEGSNGTRWLASASNDGTTRLYNLGVLFEKPSSAVEEGSEAAAVKSADEPLMIISSEATLQGHGVRVISCAWSPHDKNLLVTVAYDCTAIIWNIEDGSHVARYMEHRHRLVACCFHPTDPYKVISVSDEQSSDFSVHMWDYRQHPFRRAAPKAPGCKPVQAIKAANETIRSLVDEGSSAAAQFQPVEIKEHKDKIQHAGKAGPYKKPKPKSLLPLTSNGLINSKCSITEELIQLVDNKPSSRVVENGNHNGGKAGESHPDPDHPSVYLGVLGNSEDCVKMLQVERGGHDTKKQLDQSAILSTWMGDPRWLEQAIKNRQVTEAMLPLAAFFSRKLYAEAMSVYAEVLIDSEDYVRASTFYLILGKRDAAVRVLVDHALFREAVALIKTNFPEDKELLGDVLGKWAWRAISDGNFELATKIYTSSSQYANALTVIEKRALPYAFQAGCYLSMKLGDDKNLELFGVKFVLDGIVRGAYSECYGLIEVHPPLKWLTSIIKVHECLSGYAKYASGIKTEKDFQMWRMVLANLIDGIQGYMGQIEGKDLDSDSAKITSNILVSIPQNETDAHQIITKNLSLMMIGIHDSEQALVKASEIIKLANAWFEKKQPPLYFSVVMATCFVVTEFKYSSDDNLPEMISAARINATKLLKASLNIEEHEDQSEAIVEEYGAPAASTSGTNGVNNEVLENAPASAEMA